MVVTEKTYKFVAYSRISEYSKHFFLYFLADNGFAPNPFADMPAKSVFCLDDQLTFYKRDIITEPSTPVRIFQPV